MTSSSLRAAGATIFRRRDTDLERAPAGSHGTFTGEAEAPHPAQRAGRSPLPRVSIGLPTFNGAAYLEEAINSLLGQTFTDFELIISDNGSTDATPEICRRAAARDARVRVLRSDENHGLAWNHNRVAAAARGEYFMWASDDDRFAPDYLDRCVAVLDADPGIVYCYGETILTDSSGRILGREVGRFTLAAPEPHVRFWELLVVRGGQNTYGVVRTAVLRRIQPHLTFPWSERVIFSELSLYGRFACVHGPMYLRRIHQGQLSAARTDRVHEAIVLDPRRSPWWRHFSLRMRVEYVAAFARAISRAPLTRAQRGRCYLCLARWAFSKVPGLGLRDPRARSVLYDTSIAEVPITPTHATRMPGGPSFEPRGSGEEREP
jgi:glycosyltransferase involved in cell wall biosynthesis